MKKTVTVEIDCCDLCGKEYHCYKCFSCDKEVCNGCYVRYEYGAYSSGWADGFYCQTCDTMLAK